MDLQKKQILPDHHQVESGKKVIIKRLGLIDYKEAWDYQTGLFNDVIEKKLGNRDLPIDQQLPTTNYILTCEHPHVFTLGKSGKKDHLLINEKGLEEKHANFYEINRGGDITYHGPGQLVIYPIIDLDNFFTDIHKYMRFLEETVIQTVAEYGITAGRVQGMTGVWIDIENSAKARKICAMGVKTSRWVTMHGLALNINTDLSYFNNIVPCGINDKAVTSLEKELGRKIDMKEAEEKAIKNLTRIFEMHTEE